MDGQIERGWIERERTFEELEIPPELEAECAAELANTLVDDGLPYMAELDPDAEYIKAVAAGLYRHGDPAPPSPSGEAAAEDEQVLAPAPDDAARLAGFASVMGWGGDDMTEEGYLKAVVQNKAGKAAVIRDLTGIDGGGQ